MKTLTLLFVVALFSFIGCTINAGLSIIEGRIVQVQNTRCEDELIVKLDVGNRNQLVDVNLHGADYLEFEKLIGKKARIKYERIKTMKSLICDDRSRLWWVKEI